MKTVKWTRADERRANKMGWGLSLYIPQGAESFVHYIETRSDQFETNENAADWVVDQISRGSLGVGGIQDWDVCRKALFLCAKG